jgi:prephenate dehydratase
MVNISSDFVGLSTVLPKLFYLGPFGSYHSSVGLQLDKNSEFEHIGLSSFQEIFQNVISTPNSVAVVAYTNKLSGDIKEVHELLHSTKTIKILSYLQFPITLSLLAKNNESSSAEYSKVFSHPKALSQCSNYLSKFNLQIVETSSTSQAAKIVSESKSDADCCIGDKVLSKIYNLQIVSESVGDSEDNFTTFAIITNRNTKIIPNQS